MRNCSLAGPHWQWVMAQAMASAASSGRGTSSMCKSSFTICCTCFLSALPQPVTACLICMGVYSYRFSVYSAAAMIAAPRAAPTIRAVVTFLAKNSSSKATSSG